MLDLLEWSEHDNHEERVINESILSKDFNILLELRENLLSLSLGDVEFLEGLKEILILQGQVLELVLLALNHLDLQNVTRVFKDLSPTVQIPLDVKVENKIIRFQRA